MKNKERSFYNAILTEHNLYPGHKYELSGATAQKDGVNPSCGDTIRLNLKIEEGVITDGSFVGDGCAISQASADIMLDMIIGKSREEADNLALIFLRMIRGEATKEEVESLEEAGAFEDVAHMPARVKCAVLGWHTLREILEEEKSQGQ